MMFQGSKTVKSLVTLSHSQKSEKDKCSFSSFTSFPLTFNSVQAQSGGWWLTHTHPCSPDTYTEEGERRAFLSVCLFCLIENVKWGHRKGEVFDLCHETPSYVWLWPNCPHYHSVVWMKYIYHRCCTPIVEVHKPIVPKTNKPVKLQAQNSTKNPLPV